MITNAFEEALEEARYDAEAYKAFWDSDIAMGEFVSAKRWERLYDSALIRIRMYELMGNFGERRVGNC